MGMGLDPWLENSGKVGTLRDGFFFGEEDPLGAAKVKALGEKGEGEVPFKSSRELDKRLDARGLRGVTFSFEKQKIPVISSLGIRAPFSSDAHRSPPPVKRHKKIMGFKLKGGVRLIRVPLLKYGIFFSKFSSSKRIFYT
jgi:hypothetical protein